MVTLNARATISSLMDRIRGVEDTAALRASPARARYLGRVGRVLTGTELSVTVTNTIPTADIDARSRDEMEAGEPRRIRITSNHLTQEVTDYDRAVYDLVVQEALLMHELGHILYTDNSAYRAAEASINANKAGFKQVWNAIEDGAIETALARDFNVSAELDVLNANLFATAGNIVESVSGWNAVHCAALDLAVWNTGATNRITSGEVMVEEHPEMTEEFITEILPAMRECISEVLTEPNGAARTEHIRLLWTQVLQPWLNTWGDQTPPGASDVAGCKPDDSPNGAEDSEGMEASALSEEDKERLEEMMDEILGGPDNAESSEEAEEGAGDEGAPGEGDESSEGGESSGDGSGDEEMPARVKGSVDRADEELAERFEREVRMEANDATEAADGYREDLETYKRAIDEAGEEAEAQAEAGEEVVGVPDLHLLTPRYDDGHTALDPIMRAKAEVVGRQLEQVLGDRLRQERRKRVVKGRVTGALDKRGMRRWERGDHRIFRQNRRGNEKDYNAMLVIDRSGSMYDEIPGDNITPTVTVAGGFTMALESLGIGVSIVDFFRNKVRLVKPFGTKHDAVAHHLYNKRTKAGTPLGDALFLARKGLEDRGGNRFLIVLTDGESTGGERDFEDELSKCNFPVIGVYLATEHDSEEDMDASTRSRINRAVSHYHRHAVVYDEADLHRTIRGLAQEVMF